MKLPAFAVPWKSYVGFLARSSASIVVFATLCVAIGRQYIATTATAQVSHQEPSSPRDGSVPPGSFHIAYGSGSEGKDNDDGVSLEVIVSPGDRHIDGIFRMRRPDAVQAHVSGSYAQETASSAIVMNLVGYPQYALPCTLGNHGRQVFQNAQIGLRIEPGWRSARADIAYSTNPGPPVGGRVGWKELSGIALKGGVPTPWRGITDILWSMPGVRKPWNDDLIGRCFQSDAPARRRLRLLGTDSSQRLLQIRSEAAPDPHETIWSVLNDSDRHVLASISCASQEPGERQIDEETTLVHPYERLDVFVLPKIPKRDCKVGASHYD